MVEGGQISEEEEVGLKEQVGRAEEGQILSDEAVGLEELVGFAA